MKRQAGHFFVAAKRNKFPHKKLLLLVTSAS